MKLSLPDFAGFLVSGQQALGVSSGIRLIGKLAKPGKTRAKLVAD
jgi:hypothetical protein